MYVNTLIKICYILAVSTLNLNKLALTLMSFALTSLRWHSREKPTSTYYILLSMQTLSVDNKLWPNISKIRNAFIEPEYFRLHNTIQYIQERSQPAHIAFNSILKVQTFLASHPMYQFIKRFFVPETFHICSAWFYGFWGHENIGMGLRPSITVKGSKHINKVSHRERARVLKPKWNTQKKTTISCGSSVRN